MRSRAPARLALLAGLCLWAWAGAGRLAQAESETPYVEAAPATPGKPATPAPAVRLRAAGDLAFSWQVGEAVATTDFDPFAALKGALGDADVSFANLETVLSQAPAPKGVVERPGVPLIRGAARAAELAAKAGIDVVSVANNHAFDFGAAGLKDTLTETARVGLVAIGAGVTADDAARPHIIVVRGLRIGMLALAEKSNHPANGKAALHKLTSAEAAIRALRPQVDVVVVSVHWGVQYQLRPTKKQVALAHAMIDAGADAIIGHHPHVLQTIEAYQGKPIFYSLGNFVFGTQPMPRRLSAIVELELGPRHVARATVLPVVLSGERGSPTVSLGPEGDDVRERLREASAKGAFTERAGMLDLVLTPPR